MLKTMIVKKFVYQFHRQAMCVLEDVSPGNYFAIQSLLF